MKKKNETNFKELKGFFKLNIFMASLQKTKKKN